MSRNKKTTSKDPLKPEAALLAKLGMLVSHIEEALHNDKAHLSREFIRSIAEDQDVKNWMADMRVVELLPAKKKSS